MNILIYIGQTFTVSAFETDTLIEQMREGGKGERENLGGGGNQP